MLVHIGEAYNRPHEPSCGTMLSECIVSYALGTQGSPGSLPTPPVDEANLFNTVPPHIDIELY